MQRFIQRQTSSLCGSLANRSWLSAPLIALRSLFHLPPQHADKVPELFTL